MQGGGAPLPRCVFAKRFWGRLRVPQKPVRYEHAILPSVRALNFAQNIEAVKASSSHELHKTPPTGLIEVSDWGAGVKIQQF